MDFFNKLKIIGCNACGFSFSWPELPDSDVNLFYKENYRRKDSPFYINFSKLKEPFRLSSRSLSQVLLAKQFVDFKEKDIFLDVGPGDGVSFSVAINVLPHPQMCAIELNKGSSIAYKEVYGVSTFKNIKDVESSHIKAKIILLSHSFEHIKLTQLSYFLEKVKNIIDDDGVMLIEVPLVDMRKHKLFRSNDAPHFLFFSRDSIRTLFEKHNWNVIFLNSVSKKYSKDPKHISEATKNVFIKFLVSSVRKILKTIPLFIVRALSKYIGPNINEDFSYGGDRTCLRLIVKKHNI